MSIEQLPATTIHRHDKTEKIVESGVKTQTHTLLPFSFIQKIGHKFARIPFDTVPHKSHNAINIDFSIAFWYLYVLSGILVAFRYFGAFRYLYAPVTDNYSWALTAETTIFQFVQPSPKR